MHVSPKKGKVYGNAKSADDKSFPLAPLEDLGFMALGEGRWLPVSLEWLETFFIAVLGGWMVLLWLTRILLNLRAGGPKVAIASRDMPDRPVLFVPVGTLPLLLAWGNTERQIIMPYCRHHQLPSNDAVHPDAGHLNLQTNGHGGRARRPPSLYHLSHDAGG